MKQSLLQAVAARARVPVFALLAGCLLLAQVSTARAAQFWLSGEDPVVQADKHKSEPADYMDLFSPGAPWQASAQRLSVFKVSTQFLRRGSDEQIRTMLDGLRARHLALAIEFGALVATGRCGQGVEGYAAPQMPSRVLGRLRSLGGTADYIAFDEPLWNGHELAITGVSRPGAVVCSDSIEELARQAAATAAAVRSIFPQARIGDIEPINGRRIELRQWVSDLTEFTGRYAALSGRPFAFLHCDVAWNFDWAGAVRPIASSMRAGGTRFGVIVDGDGRAPSDFVWMQQALGNLQQFSAALGGPPDDIVVQSWQPLPESVLPESRPGSLTSVLLAAEARVR